MTVAAFMDFALYDPSCGYYARAARRSGRAGDFFTSVDVGPLFGRLLAAQIAEMADMLVSGSPFDLVEAGAGSGQLTADILRALAAEHDHVYARTAAHLVERSASARLAQPAVLAETAERLASSGSDIPDSFDGVLLANELLDALPVHQVVMRDEGLKEVYVAADPSRRASGGLGIIEGPPSTPALERYLRDAGVSLEPGWRVEINLAALAWIRRAAERLRRGFMVLIDYGHEARELYSVTHSSGTLTTFTRHMSAGADADADAPPWLQNAGEQDITAHVDFSAVQRAADAEGLATIAVLDQTYFLMGIVEQMGTFSSESSPGSHSADARALKTLIMPGGLGSTMKVLILGKGMGAPRLMGSSFRVRMT